MIRICEDEDADDMQVKAEMDELSALDDIPIHKAAEHERTGSERPHKTKKVTQKQAEQIQSPESIAPSPSNYAPTLAVNEPKHATEKTPAHSVEALDAASLSCDAQVCSICSMSNMSTALLCSACSNVLNAAKCPGSWECGSTSCAAGYLNPADFGVCGICGCRRG